MTAEPDTGMAARNARPTVASPEEDPNAVVQCSSPPCFMHELDPSYLGYLGRDEVLGLLTALLGTACGGTTTEEAWRRAMLRRHIDHLAPPLRGRADGGRSEDRSSGTAEAAADDDRPDLLAARLREALPRFQDEALRGDLGQLLIMLMRSAAERPQQPPRRTDASDPV